MREDEGKCRSFIQIITINFKFVDLFSDPVIGEEFLQMYHCKKSVTDANTFYANNVKNILVAQKIKWIECKSRGMRRTTDSIVDMCKTNEEIVVSLLSSKVCGPYHLILYPGEPLPIRSA